MSDCLFCKIVAGQIPSKVVMQDDEILAFDDTTVGRANPGPDWHVIG